MTRIADQPKALIQMSEGAAEDDERDRDMLFATYGLLFFGVPGRGMENKSLMAMVQGQPNASFVSMLSRNSEALGTQHRRFCEALPFKDSIVISFFETEESPTAIQVRGLRGDAFRKRRLTKCCLDRWKVGNEGPFRGPR